MFEIGIEPSIKNRCTCPEISLVYTLFPASFNNKRGNAITLQTVRPWAQLSKTSISSIPICASFHDLASDSNLCSCQTSNLLVQHSYTCRPISARQLLNLYLDHPTPRPSVICLPTLTPSTVLFSIVQDGLLFLSPTTTEVDPLLVLEFLHRVADVLDEFLGTPLTAARVETHYHVIAQLFAEICDAGLIAQTEANALRDVVEVPSFIDKLFSGVGLPGCAYSFSYVLKPH